MMAKPIKKSVFWVLLGLFIACTLALPGFVSRESVDYYFKQISANGDLNDTASSWLPWASSSGIKADDSNCSSPLKVYMYDLPRKYNMGLLIKDEKNKELPWTDPLPPTWSFNYGVNKQHSVEYWLMVYLINGWERKDKTMAAIRVKDPEQADVYFVPFFSARSFNTFGVNMLDPVAQMDKQLQAGIVEMLSKSKWWQASQGRDHVLVVHHPNAFRHYRDVLNQSIFVVADFGRNNETVSRLNKDVVAPYVHVLPTYAEENSVDPFSARKTLLFFQGRVRRKADGIIRAKLAELLMNETDVQYVDSLASADALATSTEGMRTSRFCLHPAGDTPSSCRLFDAIVNHCVPVIISDKIELPFEDDLDYSEFSLFFSSEEAIKPELLLSTLRNFPRERWLSMWNRLKAVSHHFEYQRPAKENDAVNMIFKQIHRKVPALKLAINRSKRLTIPDWWRRRR